jgi:nitrous oxidase accessory protein NosD
MKKLVKNLVSLRKLAAGGVVLAMLCGGAGWAWSFESGASQRTIETDNLKLSQSVEVAPGEYRIQDGDGNGVVHIRGQGIVVDFQGATLVGSAAGQKPDEFTGVGVVVSDSSRVTLRNLRVRGFKVGLLVRRSTQVVIEGCDVSDNWKMHLRSTPQAEDGADWLFGHENDQDEWLRYGAGMYLADCADFVLRNNRGRRGQNGICLVRCARGQVYDNDMSFHSGWGLAMYRSSHNQIAHNKFDWCIRGYSHGVYNRGQDSAGILVYEQCCDNVFAYNSATHGGDGFFLFAGLETLQETGQGGCNRNLVYGNDFSHASNNGIEATFSDGNVFACNRMDQADHAFWGGYSYNTLIVANQISRCNHGISIEHGSNNWIERNVFERVGVAVNLWQGEQAAFANRPYGRHHHCRSEEYEIVRNRFTECGTDLRLVHTSAVRIRENDSRQARVGLELAGTYQRVRVEGNNLSGDVRLGNGQASFADNYLMGQGLPREGLREQPLEIDAEAVTRDVRAPEVPGKQDAFLPAGTLRGLEYILVDEWGPYDFSQVRLDPARPVGWHEVRLRVLGPPQPFRVGDATPGVDIAVSGEQLPASLRVTSRDGQSRPFQFVVELPQGGERIEARGLILAARWRVRIYGWPRVGPMQPPADWAAVLGSEPLAEWELPAVDFRWGGGPAGEGLPADHFGTVCEAQLRLPAGKYVLRTVSDDGVRLYLDGRLVIDNWTWHPPAEDRATLELEEGEHAVRIEHFEIDGVAQLQFFIEPAD